MIDLRTDDSVSAPAAPTLRKLAGLSEADMSNPYWLNTMSHECFQTGKHHSRDFAVFPELVGLTHDDIDDLGVDRIADYASWVLNYTNLLSARGIARIDIISPDTVSIFAGGLDYAHVALSHAQTLLDGPIRRVIAVVIVENDCWSNPEFFQIFNLAEHEADWAVRYGLGRWARPAIKEKKWSRTTRGKVPDDFSTAGSKMRPSAAQDALIDSLEPDVLELVAQIRARIPIPEGQSRCPYGFGAS